MALEGGPIFWVATHRVHHQNTDKEGDPHSPRDGGFWSHMGWILTGKAMHNKLDSLLPYVPDLRKDKFHVWISEWHWVPLTVLGVVLLVVRRTALSDVGYFRQDRFRPALHLAGQLRHAHVGIAALHDRRHVHQQFLGGHPDLRRRLAQQSPRRAAVGAPWPGLVRDRSELVRNLRAAHAWPGLGYFVAKARRRKAAGCLPRRSCPSRTSRFLKRLSATRNSQDFRKNDETKKPRRMFRGFLFFSRTGFSLSLFCQASAETRQAEACPTAPLIFSSFRSDPA